MTFQLAALLWQESSGGFWRIWHYLTQQFTFGRITVSISSVIIGVLVFMLTILLGRYTSTFFERRLARRSHIDPGLRYTICRLIRYVIIAIGSLISVKEAFAVDLTSIAVIFTALSFGIGFGLQYLASDIASGFILLFERPVRIGDRITIGEDEGEVQSINLRTTVITTSDRTAIIVPNSQLVSQRVTNWSYGDPRWRISIDVSVVDNSDVNLVTDTLIEATKDVPGVLGDPPPQVQLLKFGRDSLEFQLLVWTSKPRPHTQICSDLNYRISRLFRERSIKRPHRSEEMPSRDGAAPQEVGLLPNDDEAEMRD